MVFFKNYAENETVRIVPDPFLFFIALYEVKPSGLQFRFNIFQWPSTWLTTKTNCINL